MTTQELIDILDPHFEVVPYSGRGMDGRECVSVRLDGSQWHDACFRGIRGLPSYHHDALGKGKVIYWPDFELASNSRTGGNP